MIFVRDIAVCFIISLFSFYPNACSFIWTDIFDESMENKLEYTPLFQQYTKMIEDYIESKIQSAFPDLTMHRVESLVASKRGSLITLFSSVPFVFITIFFALAY